MMVNDAKEFTALLQECLEAMQSEQATPESLLARYPEHAAELRPHLEAAQWIYQRKELFASRAGFLGASRQRIVEQIRQESAARDVPSTAGQPNMLDKVRQTIFGQAKLAQGLTVVLLVACLLAFSGGSLAWAARTSLPGERLYPVKTALEDTRLALTGSAYGDAELYLEFSENRVVELHALATGQKSTLIAETVDEYTLQVGKGVQSLEEISAKDSSRAKGLANQFARRLGAQRLLLSAAAKTAPGSAVADLQRALRATDQGLLSVAEVLDRLENKKAATATSVSTATATANPTAGAPPAMIATLSATPQIADTSTPVPVLENSSDEDEKKPKPTRKPTKTPKELPNPTRRPPKPTPKP